VAEVTVAGVLCDMDGTLVDSNALVDRMWTTFADELGLEPAEVLDFAHGRPSRATISRYVDTDAAAAQWAERIYSMESTDFDGVVEIPGALAFTRSLPAHRWAVVTSALAGPARARLAATGIEVPPVLIGADDVERGKPDPEGYAGAARRLGLPPSDCVVFEDTDAGIEAGRAAGCTVVVVGSNASEATRGLLRVADMTQVTAAPSERGIVLTITD
jgi:sugar-phosphatase